MITEVCFVGVDKSYNQRVWGFLKYHTNYTTDKNIFIFWGRKDGNIIFSPSINDREFQKNALEKYKNYLRCDNLTDKIVDDFNQFFLVRKLKYGY